MNKAGLGAAVGSQHQYRRVLVPPPSLTVSSSSDLSLGIPQPLPGINESEARSAQKFSEKQRGRS